MNIAEYSYLNGGYEASWGDNYYSIYLNIQVDVLEDIDGEGWINAQYSDDYNKIVNNNKFEIELRGVNVVTDIFVEYSVWYNDNEVYYSTKEYRNCTSSISRAGLDYTNIKNTILKSNYGQGEEVKIQASIDTSLITGSQDYVYYDYYFFNDNYWQEDNDIVCWPLPDSWEASNNDVREITLDLKKEMILEETSDGGFTKGYIGMQDIAQMAKKFYIGLDNKAVSVAKVYIGDMDGKARLFFSNEGGSGGTILYPELYLFDSSYDYNIGSWVPVISGCNMDLWQKYYGHCFAYFPQSINGVENYESGYYNPWW